MTPTAVSFPHHQADRADDRRGHLVLPQIENRAVRFPRGSGKFFENGKPIDAIALLKEHGFNYIRLRIFVHPSRTQQGYSPGVGILRAGLHAEHGPAGQGGRASGSCSTFTTATTGRTHSSRTSRGLGRAALSALGTRPGLHHGRAPTMKGRGCCPTWSRSGTRSTTGSSGRTGISATWIIGGAAPGRRRGRDRGGLDAADHDAPRAGRAERRRPGSGSTTCSPGGLGSTSSVCRIIPAGTAPWTISPPTSTTSWRAITSR